MARVFVAVIFGCSTVLEKSWIRVTIRFSAAVLQFRVKHCGCRQKESTPMDIKFDCGWCGQNIAIDEAGRGLSIDCPQCGKPLEVPNESTPPTPLPPLPSVAPARSTKECPFCGEEVLSQAKVCRFCGRSITAPTVEKTLLDLSPSWLYFAGDIFIALLLVLLVVGVFFLIYIILKRNSIHYIVTSHKLIEKKGILSKSTNEIPIGNLQAVKLRRSLLERIFGLGTLGFSSASARENEVVFAGIRNPEEVKAKINAIQNEYSMP